METRRAVRRRVVAAQTLYALDALLCVVGTEVSIGFILLVRLNYPIAPELRRLRRTSASEK